MPSENPFFPPLSLEGEHLNLRPLQAGDFETLHAAASDPLIWAQHPEPTRYQREIFRRFFDSAIEGGCAYAVLDRRSGAIIGSSRYYDWNPASREVAIGYTFLTRPYWGGLFNLQMKRLMLDFAFGHAQTVWFHVGKHNLRSRRALEKIGARVEKEECRDVLGEIQECVFYRMYRPAHSN